MTGTYGVVISAEPGVSASEYISAVGTVLGVASELACLMAKAIDPAVKIQHQIVLTSTLGCIDVSEDLMGVAAEDGGAIIDAIEGARQMFLKLAPSVKDRNDVVIMVNELTDLLCSSHAVKNSNLIPCIYVERRKITNLIEKIRSVENIINRKIHIEYKNGVKLINIFYDNKIKKSQMTIDSDKKEYESEGRFVLSSVVLNKDKKWIAHLDGNEVNILINDKEYIMKVRSGKQKFSCDDVLVAKFYFVENKITGEKLYYIVKVVDHIETKMEVQGKFDNIDF